MRNNPGSKRVSFTEPLSRGGPHEVSRSLDGFHRLAHHAEGVEEWQGPLNSAGSGVTSIFILTTKVAGLHASMQ